LFWQPLQEVRTAQPEAKMLVLRFCAMITGFVYFMFSSFFKIFCCPTENIRANLQVAIKSRMHNAVHILLSVKSYAEHLHIETQPPCLVGHGPAKILLLWFCAIMAGFVYFIVSSLSERFIAAQWAVF
jgi:hypothetical protein